MKRIYMDYAASTPVDRRVLAAMAPYFNEKFGNPGSLHFYGQEAEAAVFAARQKIARALACSPEEIIFTGSATEANNLAIRSVLKTTKYKIQSTRPKVIISSIEHESIMETAADLEKEGVEVARIPVSKEGVVDLEKLKAALDERTVLVSVMYANNEIGVIQPISKIANIIREYKQGKIAAQGLAMTEREIAASSGSRVPTGHLPKGDNDNHGEFSISYKLKAISYPLFHTDAVQAFQYLPCRPSELGVDLMTLSAHKIYGPKGIGALYIRQIPNSKFQITKNTNLLPIITGGEQEMGLRAGTENVPYIVGFGAAVELAEKMREGEARRVLKLRDYFWDKLQKVVSRQGSLRLPSSKNILRASPRVEKCLELNGLLENRLPNNLNVYFKKHQGEIASRKPRNDEGGGLAMTGRGITAQEMLVALDINGIAASSGSACRAHTTEPSKVIMALGHSRERALSSLRFTLGRQTKKAYIDKTIGVLLKYLRA